MEVDKVKEDMEKKIAGMEADLKAYNKAVEEKEAIKEKLKTAKPDEWSEYEMAVDVDNEKQREAKDSRDKVKEAEKALFETDEDELPILTDAEIEIYFGKKKATATGEGKAPRGESWAAIEKVLQEAGEKGLTAKEIEDKGGLTGGQVRGQTFTQKGKRLRNENGRWFLMG